jgi:hypothetical protein
LTSPRVRPIIRRYASGAHMAGSDYDTSIYRMAMIAFILAFVAGLLAILY